MSHIVEINVEITINKENPDYVLHHVETTVIDKEPTNKQLAELIKAEHKFVEYLLGFKPYCIKIETGEEGITLFN